MGNVVYEITGIDLLIHFGRPSTLITWIKTWDPERGKMQPWMLEQLSLFGEPLTPAAADFLAIARGAR